MEAYNQPSVMSGSQFSIHEQHSDFSILWFIYFPARGECEILFLLIKISLSEDNYLIWSIVTWIMWYTDFRLPFTIHCLFTNFYLKCFTQRNSLLIAQPDTRSDYYEDYIPEMTIKTIHRKSLWGLHDWCRTWNRICSLHRSNWHHLLIGLCCFSFGLTID